MKRSALLVIVSCILVLGCRDTEKRGLWPRPVEPWLTGVTEWQPCTGFLQPGHVVQEASCGNAPAPAETKAAACDDIESRDQALQALVAHPSCTDAAIDALERFARTDPLAMSDVAGAYYLRAQRNDQPADMLASLRAADQAVAAAPRLAAARFNRALALEALSLNAEAIAAWNELLKIDDSKWADEARRHRDRLAAQRASYEATPPALDEQGLAAALRTGNRDAVHDLIAPFPSTAERYFEATLLSQWAAAPSRESLERVRLFAGELSACLRDDPFPLEIVAAIDRSLSSPGESPGESPGGSPGGSPNRLAALREGHRLFAQAQTESDSFGAESAATLFARAARSLGIGGSPLRLSAEVGLAVQTSFQGQSGYARAAAMLDPIEQEAREHHYRQLLAHIQATRAYFRFYQSHYAEALDAVEAAAASYREVHDDEGLAAIEMRRAGYIREIGLHEEAWREAYREMRGFSRIVALKDQNVLLGETAGSALALGYPQIALLYQNAAVELIRKKLVAVPPERLDRIRQVETNLAIAFRARAGIEAHLDHYERALSDLGEATRLANDKSKKRDENIRRAVQARVEEVRGQSLLLEHDANGAVAALTRALEFASGDQSSTFRASLLAQRARAYRLAGKKAEAERDLRDSLSELQREELIVLKERRLGENESIWSAYFSRFRRTYDDLIELLIEEGRAEEAFVYAERSRALEPIDLILNHELTPEDFRDLVAEPESAFLSSLQKRLPPGTFVIEYRILEERTYAWVVSRDRFAVVPLDARRDEVERWSAALRSAARNRDDRAFDAGLFAPFDRLIAKPLAEIAKGGQRPSRLVFVPDGAMFGMPIAALRDPETRHYLIQDFTPAIAGSTKLYLFSLARDRALSAMPAGTALVVGDPAFERRVRMARGFERLPGAHREAERIAAIYKPCALLVGEEATVPRFLDLARDSAIVHVAAHSIANAASPPSSLILLAPSPGNSGALEAKEMLTRLKLGRTRLFVLSTCSSAGGLPIGPEGVAPLVRPLIAGGVPAVIGSLWDIDDATAEELLVSFHQHYHEGSDAAAALQSAQLDLLQDKTPGLRSVFAWASFQVVGHASSPYPPPPNIKGEPP